MKYNGSISEMKTILLILIYANYNRKLGCEMYAIIS